MSLYIVFYILGVIAGSVVTGIIFRVHTLGEIQVDDEKEILQVVFYTPVYLRKGLNSRHIKLKVVHKSLNWNVPQENQRL